MPVAVYSGVRYNLLRMSQLLPCCRLSSVGAVLLWVAGHAASAVPQGGVPQGWGWERYQGIVDRQPFGKAPADGAAGEGGAAAAAAVAVEPAGPGLAETVRLSVVSLFGGTPAAGFTDTATGRSYYLFEGQSVEEYTLLAVNAQDGSVTLRKGGQEATLSLGSAAQTGGPAGGGAGTPSAATPVVASGGSPSVSGTAADAQLSYAERQRRRVEEARARMEEARRKAEEARRSQAEDVARLTGEALQRHLREVNLEMIRSGQGTPLPIELTPQEVALLATEGFDVTVPLGTPAEPTAEEAPRLRRGTRDLPEAE